MDETVGCHSHCMCSDCRDISVVRNNRSLRAAAFINVVLGKPRHALLSAPTKVLAPCLVWGRLDVRAQTSHKAADAASIDLGPYHRPQRGTRNGGHKVEGLRVGCGIDQKVTRSKFLKHG
jgi:hypothetical protein